MFDELVELVVDGRTAQQRDLGVHVELWTQHWLRRDTFKVGPRAVGVGRLGVNSPACHHSCRRTCTHRLLPLPRCQGRASVPLRDVIDRQRMRGTWPLEGGAHEGGTLTMELSWHGALQL